jgi:hypothetical protein
VREPENAHAREREQECERLREIETLRTLKAKAQRSKSWQRGDDQGRVHVHLDGSGARSRDCARGCRAAEAHGAGAEGGSRGGGAQEKECATHARKPDVGGRPGGVK